jgi:hypothetical protein
MGSPKRPSVTVREGAHVSCRDALPGRDSAFIPRVVMQVQGPDTCRVLRAAGGLEIVKEFVTWQHGRSGG